MLSVHKITFEIEGKKLLLASSIEVSPGEIFAILGSSGSGKSTFLKCVSGLLEISSGHVKVDGELVKKPSEQLIPGNKHIKIVRQDNPLFPNISLAENIAYPLRYFNKSYQKHRVNKILKLTGLSKIGHHLPRHVSEGEQQRAVIGTAIADEPKVLLLDEPFSNLDRENKEILKAEIREIVSAERMACIFVTHDIDDVFGNADRMAVLKKGRFVQKGNPQEVYLSPKNINVAKITGLLNEIPNGYFLGQNEKVFSRPEDIVLNTKGKFQAKVKRSIFRGHLYEIILGDDGFNFSIYHTDAIKTGKEVRFDFKKTLSF